MRPLLGTAALAALLLASACGVGGPVYPRFGNASYRVEGIMTAQNGGAPVSTVVYRDGAKMRVQTVLPGHGPATIVFDDATKAAYILTAAAAPTATTTSTTPTIVEPTAPVPASPTTPAAPAVPAPTTAGVGVAVRLDDADAPTPIENAWAALGPTGAKHVGPCTIGGEKGEAWTPKETPASGTPRTACITPDGIVLEVREGNAALWQATRVERGQQDAALFGIPAGYSIVDPKAVADTVGDSMQSLNSVADDSKTPVTATKPPRS